MPKRSLSLLVPLGSVLLLSRCAVGPDYVPPVVANPASFKENAPWKKAEPRDGISKGDWYTVFRDPELNDLEARATAASQTLRAAVARVTESRSAARQSESVFFPSINLNATGGRQRTSPNDGQFDAQSGGPVLPHSFNTATVPFDLSYEVDLWGRVRRAFEQAGDQAQATLADYENVLLTLKADVALDYFQIRTIDGQIEVERNSIKSYQDALDLTNSRFHGGISTQLDVEQSKATLASAQAALATLQASRAQSEHALAVLVGVPPAALSVPYRPLHAELPAVPVGLPSNLLERRPDVAAAERRVAAQNAAIGVAIAAYFPVLHLTGSAGFDSGDLALLFNTQSRIWSLGPTIQWPVFEGGQISANVKQQKAAYEENVATYRQQVLVAFQDVEDSLSSLRFLAQQSDAETRAYQSYQKALDLTTDRYKTGLVSYFDVIQAQGLALTAQQQTVEIQGNRVAATIRLIKALGGGWADSYLVKPVTVEKPMAAPTVLPSQQH